MKQRISRKVKCCDGKIGGASEVKYLGFGDRLPSMLETCPARSSQDRYPKACRRPPPIVNISKFVDLVLDNEDL